MEIQLSVIRGIIIQPVYFLFFITLITLSFLKEYNNHDVLLLINFNESNDTKSNTNIDTWISMLFTTLLNLH